METYEGSLKEERDIYEDTRDEENCEVA